MNSKTNGLGLLLKTIWNYENCFLSPVATDGKDGSGLKFEKSGYVLKKSSRNLLWLVVSDKIHLISSS